MNDEHPKFENMTWEEFVSHVQDLAVKNKTDYVLYEHKGLVGYLSDMTKGLPPHSLYMGEVFVLPFEGEMTAFYKEPEGTHFHADRPTRLRGGQPGNRNRAKGKYKRVVISLSGPDYDALVDAISANGPVTDADVEDAVYAAIRLAYPQR